MINEWLNAEIMVQLISSAATSLTLLFLAGTRMITDALNRYDTFVKPRINYGLIFTLRPIKDGIKNCNTSAIHPSLLQKINKTESTIRKNGQFFLTKLYEEKSLNKLNKVSKNIDAYWNLLPELLSYQEEIVSSAAFLDAIICDGRGFEQFIQPDLGEIIINKVKTENVTLINNVKKQREQILKDITEVIDELDNFLEAN